MEQKRYPVPADWSALLERPAAEEDSRELIARVEQVIGQVRTRGDAALLEFAERFDGVRLDTLAVPAAEIEAAGAKLPESLKAAIRTAASNIETFHRAQRSEPLRVETMPGVTCWQRSVPIDRVGLYVPGGSAPLFSTVLMLALPARLAGCREVILCTPPRPAPEILWTASLCGVTKIFQIGGAQAIAAMAFGTDSVPKVDKIFGPGNRYVTAAKQLLGMQAVAIDMPAGPSEVMVLADDSARADFVAADLLSQAEHGADSQALLITTSESLADAVERSVGLQLETLSRADIARRALEKSRIVVVSTPEQMIEAANRYAPEHLILSVENPEAAALQIRNAGSIFLGNYSPESVGDYASGTNHTLPTAGWAAAFSGVNLDSFCKKITWQRLTPEGLAALGPITETMAAAEGLAAHRQAVTIRLNTLIHE